MFLKTSSARVVASTTRVAAFGKQSLNSFDFEANDGFLYVAVRAVSASVNSNYDGFTPEVLRESYETFVGKPVFVNHESDDIERARGVIIDSVLHDDDPDDVWVEVLMEMDEQTFPVLCGYIRSGELDTVSMGCYLTHTICSVCGHIAYTEDDYCEHIENKGTYYENEDGELVLAYEDCQGVSFYEESWVYVPADDTAMTKAILDEAERVEQTKEAGIAVPMVVDEEVSICPLCGSGQFDGHLCPVCGYEDENHVVSSGEESAGDREDTAPTEKRGGRNMNDRNKSMVINAARRRAALRRAEMARRASRKQQAPRRSASLVDARYRVRRRAEQVPNVTTDDQRIDLTTPAMPQIPVAPVNEVNLDEKVARARRARARRRAEMARRAALARRRQAAESRQLSPEEARRRARAAARRRAQENIDISPTVDVEEPVTDVPVAPVNEVILPEPAAPIISEDEGGNQGGIDPEPSVVADEYSETPMTTVAKSRASFVKAHQLAELRKEMGLERKNASTSMLADKISRSTSLREITARIDELNAVKKAKATEHGRKSNPVAPRRASRVTLASRRKSDDSGAEGLFLR